MNRICSKVKKLHSKFRLVACLLLLFSACVGCNGREDMIYSFALKDLDTCYVVLEQGEGYQVEEAACHTSRGKDIVYLLQMEEGYAIEDVDYEKYDLTYTDKPNVMQLTLRQVMYSMTVKLQVRQNPRRIAYLANGGMRMDGGEADEAVVVAASDAHRTTNTSTGTTLFERAGYTLIGWNTMADGSGAQIGLGSRVEDTENLVLYAQWIPWTDMSAFTYELENDYAVITGYHGKEGCVAIPAKIQDKPVIAVRENTFKNGSFQTVVFPITMQTIEDGAFSQCDMEEIYLYDNLVKVSDYSFMDCDNLRVLHLNAVESPVYSGSYLDTFPDKYDRLLSIKDKKKIVLFSGSSTRFGYDSAMIDAAFPDAEVVNMGVFAYTNAAPQLMLILDCMKEGDILVHAPEFDAAKRQFCTTQDLDASFFGMMESNYDILTRLDITQFHKVFSSLCTYLTDKGSMEPKSYGISAAELDEDGKRVEEPSYNAYGDYSLYRPNAKEDTPIYGLAVEYRVEAFPENMYIDAINEMYKRFLNRGVSVYFTYAPRNQEAISEDSTPEARAELDQYFRDKLCVPVISELEESLYAGRYLFGTDNHLSTEGVELRTKQIIQDIKEQMEKEGGNET